MDDDPKSHAGKRPISLPRALRADIDLHLSRYAEPGPTGRLFVGPQGGVPRRRNFNRVWKAALGTAGAKTEPGLHLHDLRYTGSTWSAQSGATLKELMARIGHSSTRAAMLYQHATRDRDEAIANALDTLIDSARERRSSVRRDAFDFNVERQHASREPDDQSSLAIATAVTWLVNGNHEHTCSSLEVPETNGAV